MKRLLTLVAFFATLQASAQQVNPVPDYVFRNQMSVGRGTVTDTAAYFSIGPRYGANKGFMPPIVVDTATFSSGKRNGLLIFSVQKNKFLYWDSVRVQWSDMAGSSGSYITGSGITGYLPQFSASTTLDTSALFTLGNRLGIGTSTFAYNSTNTANIELNGTAGGILGFKRNDSARGYLWHTGDNMELANTAAGSISFNTNSATRGSISSAGVWRLHNLAGTGDRVVIASSNGTLSASTSVTGLVDTTTISTRAWRQKGLDSLAALEVSGSGTTNYVAKFTAGSTIGNSQIFDNGTNVGIGTASPISGSILDVATAATAITRIRSTDAVNGSYLLFQNATTGTGISNGYLIGTDNGNSYLWNYESKPISFATTATERMRITAAGNIGIGTTTPVSYAGYTTLAVNNATNGGVIDVMRNNSLILQIFGDVGASGIGSIANVPFTFKTNSIEQGRINTAGEFLLNSTNSDAGDYKLQVSGNIYNTGSAVLAATSGNVGVGTASPSSLGKVGIQTDGGTGAGVGIYSPSTTNGAKITLFDNINNAGIYGAPETLGTNLVLQTNGTEKVRVTYNGNVGIGTASPSTFGKLAVLAGNTGSKGGIGISNNGNNGSAASPTEIGMIEMFTAVGTFGAGMFSLNSYNDNLANWLSFKTTSTGGTTATRMTLNSDGELLINTTSDAGDYKLQVSGNALVTAGKLDITTNTGFGLSVSRSGTNVVAGQINNSNGILYYGAESSTGGGLFTGSSAYAAVIGSGAAYPLQFATDNVTRATINTNGELLINTTTDNGDFKLQVNGSALVSGSIQTANPVSGTAVPWRLGSVVATNVQLDTANYVEVNINGTFYRLAIVTPL